MTWREVRTVVPNAHLTNRTHTEMLDGNKQLLSNKRSFSAVTGNVTKSFAKIFIKKMVASFTKPIPLSLLLLKKHDWCHSLSYNKLEKNFMMKKQYTLYFKIALCWTLRQLCELLTDLNLEFGIWNTASLLQWPLTEFSILSVILKMYSSGLNAGAKMPFSTRQLRHQLHSVQGHAKCPTDAASVPQCRELCSRPCKMSDRRCFSSSMSRTLFKAMQNVRQTLLQFLNVENSWLVHVLLEKSVHK